MRGVYNTKCKSTMILESLLASIVGGTVVWGFSELTHRRRSSGEHRAAIGRVLFDLAEVRHRLTYVSVMGELLDSMKDSILPHDRMAAKEIIGKILPPMPDLQQRLDEALRFVAGTDPDLAFRMRSKDQVESILSRWQALVTEHVDEVSALQTNELIEPLIINSACETLDEAILELAKRHGSSTLSDFEKRVSKWKDRSALLAEIRKELSEKVPQLACLLNE